MSLITWQRPPEDGDDAAIILLPGMSGNHRQWDRIVGPLSQLNYGVGFAAPVMRHDDFGGKRPTVTRYGSVLGRQIREAELGRVVLVSHSVGAFPAIAASLVADIEVPEIIVVNGGLSRVGRFIDAPLREAVRHPRECLTYLRLFALVTAPVPRRIKALVASRRWTTRLVLGDLVSNEGIATQEQRHSLMLEAGKFETLIGLLENRHHWPEFLATAPHVQACVRFLVGDRDPMTSPADTQVMVDLLPHAFMQVLTGVGHAAPLEAPGAVMAAIEAAVADPLPS
jgi:pimeloyl-ACP methyl ester carboxylesterase